MRILPHITAEYNHLRFDYPLFTLDAVIWSLCGGLSIAAAVSFFHRRRIYKLIRALEESGADSPVSAKTLKEIGLGKKPLLRHALRSGSALRRMVLCANEEQFPPRKLPGWIGAVRKFFLGPDDARTTDFSAARFYLPEEHKYAAEQKYEEKSGIPGLILSIVLLLLAGAAALYLVPQLLTMLDNLLTQFGGS